MGYRLLLLSLLLTVAAAAQQVRLVNFAETPYRGWVRATVDVPPSPRDGITEDGVEYRTGRRTGPRSVVVDLKVHLPPQRPVTVRLSDAAPSKVPPPAADEQLTGVGLPSISGAGLELAPTSVGGRANPLQDGAGYVVHWRGRPFPKSPMWHADVWLTYYPDQPWAIGELVLTASNPAVPDLRANVPDGGISLSWSNALCLVDGLPAGQPVLREGDFAADGQARSFRFVLGYLGRMGLEDVRFATLDAEHAVCANGIMFPGPLGLISTSRGYDARPWVIQHWQGARQRLHTWNAGPLGVAANSGQTGAQEDQGHAKGSRAYAEIGGVGVEAVRYYVALGQSRRPMHHLEESGDLLALTGHPDLVMWSARAHWHKGVSPDQLGKPQSLQTGWRSHGWNGPDREHWFINSLAFAAQVTASPALQWQLEAHVRIWHYQETIDPRLSTSRPDAARSQGWAGIVAAHLWTCLENRELATLVRDRWQARVREVYLPHWRQGWRLWDVQRDPRVLQYVNTELYPNVSMLYQSGLATMGVEIASEVFGMPAARQEALAQATKIIERGYQQLPGGEMREWEIVGIDPGGNLATELVEGVSAHRTGWYGGAWMPCAAWVVLQHDPDNARARRIYEQATMGAAPNDWLPPLR